MPSGPLENLKHYLEKYTPKCNDPQSANYYQNYPKFFVSLLKAMYGDAATPENDFGYNWLPKLDDGKHYSLMHLFDEMYAGKIKGLFAYGTDPAVSSPNTNKVRKALEKLDFLVCANIFDNETASFWFGPGVDPKQNKTEVFLLPAAATMEKEGSQSNSGRWVQWKYKATNPPEDAIAIGDIQIRIMDTIKALYAKEGGPNAEVHPEPQVGLQGPQGQLRCAQGVQADQRLLAGRQHL